MKIRKEVALFAQAMERKLRKNDYKIGWKECSPDYLITKLHEELKEFQVTIDNGFTNRMLHEGADIANIVMMLCDIGERLNPKEKTHE